MNRTRIIAIEPMARRLAGYRPQDRATPQAAIQLLLQEGYHADDIHAGLDAVMARVGDVARAAASEHPIARAIAVGRDLAACAAIIVCVALWALPA